MSVAKIFVAHPRVQNIISSLTWYIRSVAIATHYAKLSGRGHN